jgi:hypothetical protein
LAPSTTGAINIRSPRRYNAGPAFLAHGGGAIIVY